MYTHTYSGSSIQELLKQYSTGEHGFYPQYWYKTEAFFTEKPPKGTYEIHLGNDLKDRPYEEQLAELPEGFKPIHPAILIEFLLAHFKETGEYLMKDWWSRTSSVDSDGDRVNVGDFDSGGLSVDGHWGGDRHDDVGLSSARKFTRRASNIESSKSDSLSLEKIEKQIQKLEIAVETEVGKLRKLLKL